MLDFTQEEKDFFMSEALKEAEKSLDKAEIPIGCVIVKDGEVLGRGHNALGGKNAEMFGLMFEILAELFHLSASSLA